MISAPVPFEVAKKAVEMSYKILISIQTFINVYIVMN